MKQNHHQSLEIWDLKHKKVSHRTNSKHWSTFLAQFKIKLYLSTCRVKVAQMCCSKYLHEAWRKEYLLSQSHQWDPKVLWPNYDKSRNIKKTNGIICSVEHEAFCLQGIREMKDLIKELNWASSLIPQLDQRCLPRDIINGKLFHVKDNGQQWLPQWVFIFCMSVTI